MKPTKVILEKIQIIHHVIDTNESVRIGIVFEAALTGRGLAKAHREYAALLDWRRLHFGPGCIRPKHSWFGRIVRADGSIAQAPYPEEGDDSKWHAVLAPIDPFDPLHTYDPDDGKTWTERANELLVYVANNDKAQEAA